MRFEYRFERAPDTEKGSAPGFVTFKLVPENPFDQNVIETFEHDHIFRIDGALHSSVDGIGPLQVSPMSIRNFLKLQNALYIQKFLVDLTKIKHKEDNLDDVIADWEEGLKSLEKKEAPT